MQLEDCRLLRLLCCVYLSLFLISVSATETAYAVRASSEKPGACPQPSGLAGICVFDPDVNCLSDAGCSGALKCCPEGCNKICKEPVSSRRSASTHAGTCPEPDSEIGICVLLPNSCLEDESCAADEKCCPEGCNLVCKKALQTIG